MPKEPNYTKTILCLANSRRPGGRCVAGKDIENGAWIRPVNEQNAHAISESDLQLQNGTAADVLDVISVPMIRAAPLGHQTENHLIDPKYYWEKERRATWEEVVEATDDVAGQLWSYGSSSFHGHNDKVSEAATADIDYSLILIKPTTLTLIVGPESQYMGGPRRRIRASFTFNNIRYNFVVTDPWAEAKYFAGNDGRYEINESRICISLPEIFNGTSTKLVTTVITPERCTEK